MGVFRRVADDSSRVEAALSIDGSHGRAARVRFSILSRELSLLLVLAALILLGAGLIGQGDPAGSTNPRSFRAHETLVEASRFAADGQTMVSCGWDKQVKFWDLRAKQPRWGREQTSLPHEWHVFDVAMTPLMNEPACSPFCPGTIA